MTDDYLLQEFHEARPRFAMWLQRRTPHWLQRGPLWTWCSKRADTWRTERVRKIWADIQRGLG